MQGNLQPAKLSGAIYLLLISRLIDKMKEEQALLVYLYVQPLRLGGKFMAIRQFVKFSVGDEEFGVEISKVREIIKLQDMLRVPNAPPYIEGLMNLRGKVLTIYNLRKRLGMQDKEFDENCKIITVYHNDLLVGFTVDMVNEVIRVEEENIDDTPPSVPGIDKRFLSQVVKLGEKLMFVLDLNNVLSPDEEAELREFVSNNEDTVL